MLKRATEEADDDAGKHLNRATLVSAMSRYPFIVFCFAFFEAMIDGVTYM